MSNRNRGDKYEYFVTLNPGVDKKEFYRLLSETEGVVNVEMERGDNLTQL